MRTIVDQAIWTAVFLGLFAAGSALASESAAASQDGRLEASRELAGALQAELGNRLQAALAEDGPVGAIEVCRTAAPGIATRLSERSGAQVGRTALRLRNPVNAPDPGERVVLEGFAQRFTAGEGGPIEDYQSLPDGRTRYMRAIVTQPMCLACHGSTLAEPVRKALAEHYPADEATGYFAGDLRGAFVVEWPPAETGATLPRSELGDLLRATLEHPDIMARRADASAARSELAAATARYFGAGSVGAEAQRFEGERFVGPMTPTAFTDPPFARDVTRYGAMYAVPLDLFGVIASSRAAARGAVQAAGLAERGAQLAQLHETTGAYARLQALQRRASALSAQRERVTTTIARVRREVDSGQLATVDLRLAESELARVESDELRLKAATDEALAALHAASGVERLPAAQPVVAPEWPDGKIEDALPAALADAHAAVAKANAEEAHRTLWPAFSAVADYAQFDGGDKSIEAWGAGLRFSIPLDSVARRRASAADARARAAESGRDAARRLAARQWASLRASYLAALGDIEAVSREITYREEVVRTQMELARVGLASLEDLLRQQRDLLDAEARRADAHSLALVTWSAAQVLLGSEPVAYITALDR
jgi:outer membrane protein TolC